MCLLESSSLMTWNSKLLWPEQLRFKQIGNQGAVLPRCMVCPNINHPAPKNKGTKLQMRSPWLGENIKDTTRRPLERTCRDIHGDIDKATEEIKISILRFQHGTNIFSVLSLRWWESHPPNPIHPYTPQESVPRYQVLTPIHHHQQTQGCQLLRELRILETGRPLWKKRSLLYPWWLMFPEDEYIYILYYIYTVYIFGVAINWVSNLGWDTLKWCRSLWAQAPRQTTSSTSDPVELLQRLTKFLVILSL